MKTISQLFADAADILETKGWTTGSYQDLAGCYCAQGALVAAIDPDTPLADPYNLCMADFATFCNLDSAASALVETASLLPWNDIQKSAAPVIALFRQLAEETTDEA